MLAKSVSPSHIAENLSSYDLKLDSEDMKQLEALDRGYRLMKGHVFLTEGQTLEDFWDNE